MPQANGSDVDFVQSGLKPRIFFLIHLAPSDLADTIAQSMGGADLTVMAEIRADYGLDQPYIIQLGSYIGKVMQMDLGYSFFTMKALLT